MSVYEQVLGEDFQKLGESLQRFHSNPSSCRGLLTVTHDPRPIPRLFVWLMKLPPAGSEFETVLKVTSTSSGEIWTRQIGQAKLKTRQSASRGKLVESAGPLSFRFDLSVSNQALVFQTYRTSLLGIPIPKHIAPFIDATATPLAKGWRVEVNIQCPRYGTICRYEGEMVLP